MIKNSHEFNLTSSILAGFNARRKYLIEQLNSSEYALEISAIDTITVDLQQQLQLYQNIVEGNIVFDRIDSLQDVPYVIVGKRIQLGYTQTETAQEIGIDTDEYVRIENNDFYGIGSDLFRKLIEFLRLENPNQVLVKDYSTLIRTIESNVRQFNIMSSILPISLNELKQLIKEKPSLGNYYIEKTIALFAQMFSINITEEVSSDQINTNVAVAFKHRINVDANNLTIVTGYAAYIAGIVAKQISSTTKSKPDPIMIRRQIIENFGAISLEACIDYLWNLNIAVIPLNIKKGFHGACFDFEGTIAIVLNQQNKTISRWKFDLLHELYHALTMEYTAYIEQTDIMYQDNEEEKLASEFASNVIFGQEMDSLLKLIIERSESQIEQIKSNTIAVAIEYGINIDDLANYVAFRISKRPISFWGVAANLQADKRNPLEVVRSQFYEKLNIDDISQFELEILRKSLYMEVD